jgi:hypothetical protein
MNAIQQAEELREQAIQLLLAEQDLIKERLHQWGYDKENSQVGKRRGRRPKAATECDVTFTEGLSAEKVGE